jgi:hypothetical protein
MLLFMPAAKAGIFGNKLGFHAALVLLAYHLVYGAVLGTTYGLLTALAPVKKDAAQPGAHGTSGRSG